MHVRAWRHAYAGLMPAELLDGLDVDERATAWRNLLDAGSASTIVAVEQSTVTGFVAVTCDGAVGTLAAIYLEPGHIGTGLGARLHDAGLERLRTRGATHAALDVLPGNERARLFYERHHWRAIGDPQPEEHRGFVLEHQRYERDL